MSEDEATSSSGVRRRRRRCVCRHSHCISEGFEGCIQLPVDPHKKEEWLRLLGWNEGEVCTLSNPRVALAHFHEESLYCPATEGKLLKDASGKRAAVTVMVLPDHSPDVSNEDMEKKKSGVLERYLRAQAHCRSLVEKVEALRASLLNVEVKLGNTKIALEEKTAKLAASAENAPVSNTVCIDYTIMSTLNPAQTRAMSGMPDLPCFEALYALVDDGGAAQNMDFYGEKGDAGGERIKRRSRVLGGMNGLFFALFVIRTATSLAVASALFGVSEQTAGRAFTTWVCFLRRSLRPFVRLPTVEEVEANAPPNFGRANLGKCILVVDGVELETMRAWQAHMAHVLWSPYKGRPTGKLMVAVTPGGAICYIGPMYGGRLSDADIVKRCGLIESLVQRGFAGGGFSVMADRGFNPLAASFLKERILYVAPPSTRAGEEQFATEDAEISKEVANLRIHVERAIGALREWRYLDTKFSSKQMDIVPMVWEICGSLVNMLRPPFASVN